MSNELNPYAQLDLSLIDLTVRSEVVLDALRVSFNALIDVAQQAAREEDQETIMRAALEGLEEALALVRPLIPDDHQAH
jgi:hypothetical protein